MPGSKMRLLPGIIFVPGTKIHLLPGKRNYYIDILHIQDAGSILIVRNFYPDQEGINGPLTGKIRSMKYNLQSVFEPLYIPATSTDQIYRGSTNMPDK